MRKVEVIIKNTGEHRQVEIGTPLTAIAPEGERPWLGALVNNHVQNLNYCLFKPKTVQFLDIRDKQGWYAYANSLCFMLHKAVRDTFPEARLIVEHTLINGFFCRIVPKSDDVLPLPEQAVVAAKVHARMEKLQQLDLYFESRSMLREDAIELAKIADLPKTQQLLEHITDMYVDMQYLEDAIHHTNTILVPTTGCLKFWDFRPYDTGYLLLCSNGEQEVQPVVEKTKLFDVFQEHRQWVRLLHTTTISDLNRIVRDKGANHLIQVAEALHEKKYAEIIVRLSTLLRFATEIKEMDINPLLADENDVVAVDARILIEK